MQKASGHGHFLEMKNSAYHCPYDLVDNKVNAIYIVYKIREYDRTGTEHNYLFSCGMDDNHRGVCFLKVEKTMRIYGVDGKPNYKDISNFPTSYYNPCQKDKWNVFWGVYDTNSGKSSLWVNHGKIRDFVCRLPLKASTLNLFNKVVHFDGASGFDNYIESVEMYNYYKSISSGLVAARMTYLKSIKSRKELMVALYEQIQKCRVLSRALTALDQLNHIIDAIFSSIENSGPFDRYTTLRSLYTGLDH